MGTKDGMGALRAPNGERERWLQAKERGWSDPSARWVDGLLLFLTATGLWIWLAPFSVFAQHAVLTHTVAGLLVLPPAALFTWRHLRTYWSFPLTHVKFTGWVGGAMALACLASGVVLTWQGLFDTRIGYAWRLTHQLSTVGLLLFAVPHVAVIVLRERRRRGDERGAAVLARARRHGTEALGALAAGLAATLLLVVLVKPVRFDDAFPADYELEPYAGAGPFSPSLASTVHGGAIDPRALGGSEGCGTSGCHEEIYREWLPSAHRYSARDAAFQAIQGVMAQQNGPVSTRYCAGCHDPISLFAGSKDFGVPSLTGRAGYDEGVSCLACHAIQQTDVKGNADYVIAGPERYVWELREGPLARLFERFVIRTYPDHHVDSLSRRMFKTPEFCAACHKQFIDEEVNQVGWVQLQNQYDNWKASRWNQPGHPERTLECRECHMPLADSLDPASGDVADFNRSDGDGKHRSHRFLGANQMMPGLLELEGAEEHTALIESWLKGELEVPEIAERWRSGPAVPIELDVPGEARPGETVALRVQLINNKVGHDFPTGPLDIIQAWVEIDVTDDEGRTVFRSGVLDERKYVEPGAFLFKAEPIDRYGNLIDRHNLWEMVGVRFKRSLFPGQAEVARYDFLCPATGGEKVEELPVERRVDIALPADATGTLRVEARLNYRKIDQSMLDFAFGEGSGLTAPVTVISRDSAVIRVARAETSAAPAADGVREESGGGGQ